MEQRFRVLVEITTENGETDKPLSDAIIEQVISDALQTHAGYVTVATVQWVEPVG